MKANLSKRILSMLLVVALLMGFAVPAGAANHDHGQSTGISFHETDASAELSMIGEAEAQAEQSPEYEDTDIVRVSIILEKESTLQAGFSTLDIAENAQALSYREELKAEQTDLTAAIETAMGKELDVAWNLTLAANLISANVAYGDIATIENVDGVAEVILETLYEPCVVEDSESDEPGMESSTYQVGARTVWANGYTGAGSRIAVIDTGIDTDHQSFSAKGFEYSLKLNAEKENKTLEEYMAELDLLDKEEILSVADQLNIPNVNVDKAYNSTKIPFGYNYIDVNYKVVHDYDGQGEHGSHVEGIAAANAYIPQRDGTFVAAADTVGVVGIAPDAQIISLKVFGANGGAYASDYMAAIEDAIILGCDSVNLSLGSAAPGFTYNSTYEELLNSLQESDTVVTMSGGNSYYWNYRVTGRKLYVEDIRFHTGGSPGSYSNSLAVASVESNGFDDDGNYEEPEYQTMSDFSAWGVPESLELKPEITAPGGNIYSVNGSVIGGKAYESMSGTSMAAPQMAGAAAVMAEYIRENNLTEKTGLTVRQLSQSLMMSTARPLLEETSGYYYAVLKQGSGLVQLDDATAAKSYILMGSDATAYAADGKVKAELGDDPERTGEYAFSFTINNFSDADTTYRLATELFTQATDGKYLLQTTTALNANVIYKIDGVTYVPEVVGVECDLNADGVTDAADAQIILNYCAGLTTEIAAIADVDANGTTDTYDAHLLLAGLQSGEFTVPAGKSVKVQVIAELTEEQKTALDAERPNGAYVEGYVFVNPSADEEGNACDAVHSIPVLGFYGSWTDPSMFGVSYSDQLYGDTRKAYTGSTKSNNLVVNRDGESFYQVGNPYVVENAYPEGRAAVRSEDVLESYNSMMIRNAAAMVVLIEDEAGKVVYNSSLSTMLAGAYYYVNGYAWRNTDSSRAIGRTAKELGFAEGDRFTVTVVAIPEYYALGETLTLERVLEIKNSGVLGDGAYLTTELVVDDTAPQVISVSRDVNDENRLIVNCRDNQYVAAMSLVSLDGTKTYATAAPEYCGNPNETQVVTMDITGIKAGEKCLVVLGDYAGNETSYEVTLNLEEEDDGGEGGGVEPGDLNNNFFGYSYAKGNVWMNADLDAANYTNVSNGDIYAEAAEYVDGYIYMVGLDNMLYVAPHGNWNGYTKLSDCTEYNILDLAFNYADKQLYALGEGNVIYTVDLMTGQLTKQFTITITNPKAKTADGFKLLCLAIDDEGRFYAVNNGDKFNFASMLYSFTLDMVEDGAIENLAPMNRNRYIIGYNYAGATMAWDHDDDRLYYYGMYPNFTALDYPGWWNLSTYAYVNSGTAHKMGFTAMYFTGPDAGAVSEVTEVESFTVSATEMKMLIGSSAQIVTSIKPWNLDDQSLTWETSDETVVAVENGTLTALKAGSATVTVTTNAAPYIQHKIEVTVGELPDTELRAYLLDEDGNALWVEFNSLSSEAWEAVGTSQNSYSLGAVLLKDTIYFHDRSYVYASDPDTFEAEAVFEVGSHNILNGAYYDWGDAAAAEKTEDGYFDCFVAPVNNGTVLAVFDPYTGATVDFDLSDIVPGEKLATIATVGLNRVTVVSEDTGKTYENCPEYIFYSVAESGRVYDVKLAAYPDETDNGVDDKNYQLAVTYLSAADLKLPEISHATTDAAGGMIYDAESGCLIMLSYFDGDTTGRLHAIVPESGAVLELGTVGDAVWPAYSLHQYTAPTEMTLRVRQDSLNLVEGDTGVIDASVAPANIYTGGVTFVSSDESVATVDETGKVTGLKPGNATITVTTVDTNAEGKILSKTVAVEVEATIKVDLTVNAKIDFVEEASQWVVINTTDVKNPTIKAYDHSYMKIGGVHDGKIYGGNGNWYIGTGLNTATDFVSVEPGYGYEAALVAIVDPYYIPTDITTMPALELSYTDAQGNAATITAGDMPVFVDVNQRFIMFNNMEADLDTVFPGWDLAGEFDGAPGGLAYMGMTTVNGETAYSYAILTIKGELYNFFVIPSVELDEEGNASVVYSGALEAVGNVGLRFGYAANMGMTYVNDGTHTGLLISHNGINPELYYVDISVEMLEIKYTSGKIGTIPGANFIGALHFDSELDLPQEAPNLVTGQIETMAPNAVIGSETMPEAEAIAVSEEMAAIAAAEAEEVTPDSDYTAEEGTVTIDLTEEVTVTNGIVEVTYDPKVLTYVDATSVNLIAVNPAEGKITVAYASGTELLAGSSLTKLNFTFTSDYVNTTVTVKTLQRNSEGVVTEEDEVIAIVCEVDGHNYEVTESVEATCTEDGYKIYTCTKCGDSYREELYATGHSYEKVVTAPTCTQMGYTTYTCACGDSYVTDYVNPTGHNYEKTVTEPTCTELGYTTYTCACGDSYVSDYVNPTGHDYEAAVTAPTCTEAGYTTYTCKVCGDSYVSDYIAAAGHTFGEWTVTTPATCTEDGIETRTCECGETETRTIEATGHSFGDWTVTTAPTCTEKGVETRTCACGETETRSVDALGHDCTTETVDPTCTADGYTEYTCKVCGYSYRDNIVEAIGHDYETVVTDPTCTEVGYTTHICNNCGDSYVSDYAAPTGHTFGEWIVTTEPTCTTEGIKTRTCADCGETETESVPAYCPTAGYTDVPLDAWYHDAVDYVVENGIMEGLGDGIFAPNGTTTRAQMVQVLYRLAGEPSVAGLENPFADVAADAWYADAVIWAVNEGIVKGVSDTTFAPNANVTREQLVTILYRYNGETDVDATALDGYTDAANISDWAAEAFAWAVENGIITGMTATTLAPQGTATRAQIATILMRLVELGE